MNPSDLLGGQPIQEMAPSIRGIREAPGAHSVVAARHARVECIFGNIDTQYAVNHCPILPPRVFSKSSASNNLVRRIYAHARPKIPTNLNSGAWKTGPNLSHGLICQRGETGSPFSSLLGQICLFAKQFATYKGRSARFETMPSSPMSHAARPVQGRSRPARRGDENPVGLARQEPRQRAIRHIRKRLSASRHTVSPSRRAVASVTAPSRRLLI